MEANAIDPIVAELWSVTDQAERDGSRTGYFSALYARMTAALARGVRRGLFEDGARMERLSAAFGRLYLDALAKHRSGGSAPAVWRSAFQACESADSCLLQHIYLGMNAHLLLDLPIAAVVICQGDPLESLSTDYFRINGVVRGELGGFHDDLCAVSPRLAALRRIGGALWAGGSLSALRVARRWAWRRAEALARIPRAERGPVIDRFDRSAARIAERIVRPGPSLQGVFRALRQGENEDVRLVIRALRGGGPS